VFGATSAIAGETARAFAADRAEIVLIGRDGTRLEAVAADLRARGAPRVEVLTADLAVLDEHAGLVEKAWTALGGLVTDGYKLIKPGTELYHVSIDSDVLGSHFPTRLGLLADARTFLSMALEACDRSNGHSTNGHNGNGHDGIGHPTAYHVTSPWMADLDERRNTWRQVRAELGLRDGSDGLPMRPEAVMPILDELMDDDAIVVADTGYASAWAGALLELRTAGRNFLRADGSLGWAFPFERELSLRPLIAFWEETIAPEKSDPPRPSVVVTPSALAPTNPPRTGTRPSASSGLARLISAAVVSGYFGAAAWCSPSVTIA